MPFFWENPVKQEQKRVAKAQKLLRDNGVCLKHRIQRERHAYAPVYRACALCVLDDKKVKRAEANVRVSQIALACLVAGVPYAEWNGSDPA